MDNKTMLARAASKIIKRRTRAEDPYAKLERIPDPELRKRQLEWYCRQQRQVFLLAKVAACVLPCVLIYFLAGPFPLALKGSVMLVLTGLTSALWRRIIDTL